jgi:hypothetical protein
MQIDTRCMDACQAIISWWIYLNTYLNNFKADNETSNEMIFSIESSGCYYTKPWSKLQLLLMVKLDH